MPKHILIVDDDPELCETLGAFLRTTGGYEVTTAASGEEALATLPERLPDLIILDLGMPGMGGTGFLQRITDRQGRPQVPTLILTARAEMADYFADKPVVGFFTKPANCEELLTEIQQALFLAANTPAPAIIGDDRRKTVVVAESDPIRAGALHEVLTKVGFQIEAVHTGAEAVEAVIARHPTGLILPMDSVGLTADIVLEILRKLPAGKGLPAVVYSAEQYADKWIFVDPRNVRKLQGFDPKAIAKEALDSIY